MKILFLSILFTIFLYADFTIHSGEIYQLSEDENITILEDLNISENGTFKADINCTILLDSDWVNSGNFISSSSTVAFIGNYESIIHGDNSFFNLFINKSIIFESSKTQKIQNRAVLRDAKISSTIFGMHATLDFSTTTLEAENLEIQDSKIIGLTEAINPPNSIDNGNNILWFDIKTGCQNIGSDINWLDKYNCNQDGLKYIVKGDNTNSEIMFDTKISKDIKETPSIDIDMKGNTLIVYKDTEDTTKDCSKDINIILYQDGTSVTGFQSDKNMGCTYTDPTLQNWSDFKNSTKISISKTSKLEKEEHEGSNNVIVIDVNLTKKLIIGGNYDEE